MYRYRDYKGKDWQQLYAEYKQNNSIADAINLAWQDWSHPENEFFKYYPTIELFLLMLEKNVDSINNVFQDIQWNSIPVYGTWNNYWWYYDDIWQCEEWQRWWIALLGYYGREEATNRWVYAYQRYYYETYFDDVANKIPSGCSWNCDFINYFRTQGIDVAMLGAETTCNLIDIVSNTVNVVENVTSGVAKTSSVWSDLLPIVSVVGGGLLIYNQIKKNK